MTRVWLLVAVALAGCSTVASISSGTCGNGVLEAGEDCDRFDGTCTTDCRIVCDATTPMTCSGDAIDGTCCPDGFACGVDRECHAPSGTVSQSEIAATFDADQFEVIDIDGDGIPDLLGASSGSVLARYGSRDAPLQLLEARTAPFANGGIAFGDYNSDGHVDLLIPTIGGLFAFDTSSGAPEPVAFPTAVDPTLEHVRIAALPGETLPTTVHLDQTTTHALMISVDGFNPTRPCDAAQDVPVTALRGRGLHPFDDTTRWIVPIALASSPTTVTVCMHGLGGSTSAGGVLQHTPAADGETLLADLDGDPSTCPELIVPYVDGTGAGKGAVIRGSGTPKTGTCGVTPGPAGNLAIAATIDGLPLAVLPSVVTVAGVKTAIITSNGVATVDFTTMPATPKLNSESTRDWRYAVVADFDQDGLPDFATGATSADAEVFLQRPSGTKIGWAGSRLLTGGGVYSLETGDYDGDGFPDVALATLDPTDARTGAISVAYGGPVGVGFTAPVAGPSFVEFNGMLTENLVDNSVPVGFDNSDDLVIADGGDAVSAADPGKLTDVFGSSYRDLIAPFAYASTFDPTGMSLPVEAQGIAVVIGAYAGANVIALFGHARNVGLMLTTATAAVFAWEPGAATFQSLADKPFSPMFNAQDIHFVTVPMMSSELMLGLSATATCGVGYYDATATSTPTITEIPCSQLAPDVDPTQISGVSIVRPIGDIVSDTPDILIDQVTGSKSYTAREWQVQIASGAPTITLAIDYTAEVTAFLGTAAASVACMDASGAEFGTRTVGGVVYGAGRDRVVACRVVTAAGATTQLFARYAGADPTTSHYELLLDTGVDLQVTVKAGDLDGNGLDDVVYVSGPVGFRSAHLHLQCDSHGGACGGG